jgi:acetyltransferase-like isoleucine patch superfamily enzyme
MMNQYGLSETVNNIISLIYTKIFYKGARLIRRPVFVRGKRYLQYGKGLTTGYNCRIELFNNGNSIAKKLIIGINCKMGDCVHIAASERVVIGDNCLMGSKIYISDTNHGDYSERSVDSSPDVAPDDRPLYSKPVSIGNNVWIGENVCILSGVKVGNGCVIGANSVVTKGIPDNCIAAGSPAKIIKQFDTGRQMWTRK